MTAAYRITAVSILCICLHLSATARAADLFIDTGVNTQYTSNAYLLNQPEGWDPNQPAAWDLVLAPQLDLGVDTADYWTIGYAGRLDAYTQHSDLTTHTHELYLSANPAWGTEAENAFFAQLSVMTRRNAEAFAAINYLKPAVALGLDMEPSPWFRWSLWQDLAYRWYYDDNTSNSFDSWSRASITFTAQSRTTFGPRVGYGFRHYPEQDLAVTDDTEDHQIEAGLHASQGLWESAGLQLDYAYLHAIGDSGLVLAKLTTTDFSYADEQFLFSGHRAAIGLKQVSEAGWRLGLGLQYESRAYGGWPAVEAVGENEVSTGEERQDDRLRPNVWIEYLWQPNDGATSWVPDVKLTLDYAYLRQWSNSFWHDTDQHLATLALGLSWLP